VAGLCGSLSSPWPVVRTPGTEARALAEGSRSRDGVPATLGIVLARLELPEAAVEAGERAVSLFPLERDPYTAPAFLVDLAETYAHSGRTDDAIETLERALSIPEMLTPHYIRLDPRWDPLRGHPGFERIIASAMKPLP
jgi:tetratricopeptide (TPR) repeat protein